MGDKTSHLKYRPDIDGLRALAVLSVVFFHAFPSLISGGFIGVDIFFVISGYLITSNIFSDIGKNTFTFKEFYSRRIRRIFPPLLLILVIVFWVGWVFLPVAEFAQLGKHILGGAIFLSNIFFWKESGYFDTLADAKPLLHLWSLGIEEQFYIVWPIIVLLAYRLKISFLPLIFFLLATSFLYNLLLVGDNATAAFFSPASRMWELLTGAALAYTYIFKSEFVNRLQDRYGAALSILGISLICAGLAMLTRYSLFPGSWALLPVIGAALIILAGQHSWLNKKVLAQPLLVWFGLISYPLYLWHWPVLTFYRISTLEEADSLTYLGLIAVSVLLAYGTYMWVEKPIRNKMKPVYSIPVLVLGLMLMGFLGFNTYHREGLPSRKIVLETPKVQLESAFGKSGCFNKIDARKDIVCSEVTYVSRSQAGGDSAVFLWGDSHAGHLNAGLMTQSKKLKFALYDDSMPACPPVPDFSPRGDQSGALEENRKCLEHNLNALEIIRKIHPKMVIMAANWMQYDGVHQFNELPLQKLAQTILLLRELGVESIVVLGNMPVYYVNQSKLASALYEAGIETRTYKRFDYRSRDADNKMAEFTKNNDIDFISPIAVLCDARGCLMSASSASLSPIAADTSHLSKEGSIFFIQDLINKGLIKIP